MQWGIVIVLVEEARAIQLTAQVQGRLGGRRVHRDSDQIGVWRTWEVPLLSGYGSGGKSRQSDSSYDPRSRHYNQVREWKGH